MGLDEARQEFDSGRYDRALALLRAAPEPDPNDRDLRLDRLRLVGLAAYRIGELDAALAAASALVQQLGPTSDDPRRRDMHGIGVVAAGALARHDESLEHLRAMLSMAARSRSLADQVRARGSLATWLSLLGDPWAARRVLGEVIGLFQGLTDQPRLEATARNNHAEMSMQVARMARDGQDATGVEAALEQADACLGRLRELAQQLGDARIAGFADLHEAALAHLRGAPGLALQRLPAAVDDARAAGLWAHERGLRLMMAEALLDLGRASDAAGQLAIIDAHIGEGHDLSDRIRHASAWHRAHSAMGRSQDALGRLAQAQSLILYREYHQRRAQSVHLRERLELEYVNAFRTHAPGASAGL